MRIPHRRGCVATQGSCWQVSWPARCRPTGSSCAIWVLCGDINAKKSGKRMEKKQSSNLTATSTPLHSTTMDLSNCCVWVRQSHVAHECFNQMVSYHAVIVAEQLLHLNIFAAHFAGETECVLAHLHQFQTRQDGRNAEITRERIQQYTPECLNG